MQPLSSQPPSESLRPGQMTRWLLPHSQTIPASASFEDCPPAILNLLAARGIASSDGLRRFFAPSLADLHDPLGMHGMQTAVRRIQQAVSAGEPMLIYGDYDVDGTTATVLLKTAIDRIAPPDKPAQVSYHVPHRLREGYGIHGGRLAEAAAEGVRLVISVDTGIRAFAAAAEARALGLDLIVTDHHLPDHAGGLPEAVAVLNPAQAGCAYPNKHLCGAGVAFKLAHALLTAHAVEMAKMQFLEERLLPSFLKLVAIATIADSVELTGENRALAALGLAHLSNPVQCGLRALMEVADLPLDRSPTAMDVGFRLAPRINAAGRMDVASDVIELLLTRDHEQARTLAARLNRLNEDRRASEAEALAAIELKLHALRSEDGTHPAECVVLDHPAWHRGVLGILASRIVDRTGRPALVLCSDESGAAHGSGRSVAGYHLLEALTSVDRGNLFTRFGGHAHAVGFSLPADRIGQLRARMQAHSAERLSPALLAPQTRIDAELTPRQLTAELAHWLERCAPFGQGHPEPVFLVRGLRLAKEFRIIKDRHVALSLAAAETGPILEAVAWHRSGQVPWPERLAAVRLATGDAIDVLIRIRENRRRVVADPEMEILDLAVVRAGEVSSPGNPDLINSLRFEAERVL